MLRTKTIALWFAFLFAFQKVSIGQFYDRTWVIGAIPMVTLTFNSDTTVLGSFYGNTPMNFTDEASSNVSDTNGSLLFFCNGSVIADSTTNVMMGGDTLLDSLFFSIYAGGFVEPQTNIILPRSGNTFYVFYFSESDSLYGSNTIDEPDRLYYAVVDMNQNGWRGKVISKKNVAYKGLFGQCRITACRHANGRDWWLVHQGFQNDEYFTYLVTPDSVHAPRIQHIGPSNFYADNPGSQSAFSPDGSKFATSTSYGPLLIMDFDRCTGIFSNPDSMPVLNSTYTYNGQSEGVAFGAPGCCFSPNSRFVYITNTYDIWQYDTWATNIANSATLVGQWDTVGPPGAFKAFYQLSLLPNGKIIIDNFNGSSSAFHLIDSPDVQGQGCHFMFNGLPTSTINAASLPNMINYRLGPLIGSGCDTVTGINDLLGKAFTAQMYPNPGSDVIQVDIANRNLSEQISFVLYDMLGHEVLRRNIPLYQIQVSRDGIASGLYHWQVQNVSGEVRAKGKMVWE